MRRIHKLILERRQASRTKKFGSFTHARRLPHRFAPRRGGTGASIAPLARSASTTGRCTLGGSGSALARATVGSGPITTRRAKRGDSRSSPPQRPGAMQRSARIARDVTACKMCLGQHALLLWTFAPSPGKPTTSRTNATTGTKNKNNKPNHSSHATFISLARVHHRGAPHQRPLSARVATPTPICHRVAPGTPPSRA